MTLSRRSALKLGVSAGALPLLAGSPLMAEMVDDASSAKAGEVIKARPLPLSAVRLTGGPLKHAQEMDARYLLELEPDRMLAFYRDRAGLRHDQRIDVGFPEIIGVAQQQAACAADFEQHIDDRIL